MKSRNIFVIGIFLVCLLAYVVAANSVDAAQYTPLVSGFPQPVLEGKSPDLAGYFNFIVTLVIGLTGILAVLMIIVGGIQYVSTDSWNDKDSGKKRIQAAVGGLILALSSYLILNTIDPSLTYLNFTDSLKPLELAEPLPVIVTTFASSTDNIDPHSGSLDPTGATGGLTSGSLETNTSIDTCEGLSSYRSSGSFSASDKGGTEGGVVGEIAWLMQTVPQKWPGLQVMSSYRSLRWNLISAYGQSAARADQIIAAFQQTDGSYSSRVRIASQFGVPRAALTSNHVLGKAVDFAGSGLASGQGDQLAAWARSNNCLNFSEVLWKTSGHYDHVHLAI